MPSNKNFQKRITILDECFANSKGLYTLEKLIDVLQEKMGVSISRRTIQNDIKYIEEVISENLSRRLNIDETSVFLKGLYEGKKKGFKYSSPDYALGNQLLSKSDQEQLEETLAILSRYRNRADFQWLDELIPRIKNTFNLVHEDYDNLISYQSNRDYVGQSLVGKLYNQLLRKKVLKIEYKSFKEDQSTIRTIHPYHLKQYNERWFLFGHQQDDIYEGLTNLALDRIKGFVETTEDIKANSTNWGDFFDEMIGVSKPPDIAPVKVKLRFHPKRIKYVLTKPLHGATQILDKADPEKRTILIKVIPNRELYQALLAFGSDVEVLEPNFIKDHLREQAENMIAFYTN